MAKGLSAESARNPEPERLVDAGTPHALPFDQMESCDAHSSLYFSCEREENT
jgi:hypothetical protein